MKLREIIENLQSIPAQQVFPRGFTHPHSYRGYYDELAFEPAENVTVGAMLADAKKAVGATYTAWKGGDYKMGLDTEVHLAIEGECGKEDAMKALFPSPLEREVVALRAIEVAAIKLADQTGWSDELQEAIKALAEARS